MTLPKKTDYHPQIEAVFDAAQAAPTPMTTKDSELVALSVVDFEAALEAAHFKAEDVRHTRIDRGAKPDVVLLERKTFDNLSTIKDFFTDAPSA